MHALTIIAEAAQGFEGNPGLAKLLLRAAAAAKADAVKFQLVYADELATPDYEHYPLFKALEMPDEVWIDLAEQARNMCMGLHVDVFGQRSLELAERIKCGCVKIHSSDMGNVGLLRSVASSEIPLILLSTAACTDAELLDVLRILSGKRVVLLHGFQGYPTRTEANNISRIRGLRRVLDLSGRYDDAVGFSDHALPESGFTSVLPAVAIGAGATFLEKHITLSKIMKFEDHEAALGPDEFESFVTQMRAAFCASGEEARLDESEEKYRMKTRKHLVAARPIAVGEIIAPEDIFLLRTSSADILYDSQAACGKKTREAIACGSPISSAMVGE